MLGDGGDVALEPSATGGLEVVVRMKKSDTPGSARPRQLSTASTT